MFEPDHNWCDDRECEAALERLFPHGFAGADVVREIAPEGWANSPLVAVFHPSARQLHEEAVRMHRNLRAWSKTDPGPEPPEPALAEIDEQHRVAPIEAGREVTELVGMCLWDIFSDEHDVVDLDGRVLHLGSFRGSGRFLADFVNRRLGRRRYDYIDFYLGTIWVADRADLTPVYRMIFRRLKAAGLDWIYCFPRLHLIDFKPLRGALEADKAEEFTAYSPEEALAREAAEEQRQKEIEEMRASLEEGHREAVEEARRGPPPKTVLAYQAVFGHFPEGWPPVC